MHKIKSYHSKFFDAEEEELIKYIDYGNMLIILEYYNMEVVYFDKQTGALHIVCCVK